MKSTNTIISIILLLFTSFNFKKTFKVSGTIYQNFEYCMGMRPSDVTLDSLKKYKNYLNKKLIIKKANSKKIYKVIQADSFGKFKLRLSCGTYFIYDPIQELEKEVIIKLRQEPQYHKINSKEEFEKWQKKPVMIINIKEKDLKIDSIKFTQSCYKGNFSCPCEVYIGPLRP